MLKRLELLLCTALAVVVLILAFIVPEPAPFLLPRPSPYLVIPVLVWSGVRFGLRTLSFHLVGVYLAAIGCTVYGLGAFGSTGPSDIRGWASVHLFSLAAALSSLAPAILLDAQRKINAKLLHRDSRFGGLWNGKLIGIYITDLKGNILEANDTFLALIGKTRADLESGRIEILKLATPEYVAAASAAREKFIAQGQIGPFEREWVLEDGRRFASLVYATLMDEPDRALGMVIEMEELKATKKELETRNARYRDLFSSELIGIFVMDLEGKVSEANDAFLSQIRMTRRQLEAGEILTGPMLAPEYIPAGAESRRTFRENGRIGPKERQWNLPDGTQLHTLFFATKVDGTENALCMTVDLRELHQTKQALRSVESRFRSMFDSNVLSAAIVDKHRFVVEANDAFLELSGYSREDLAGKIPVEHLIVPGNEAAHAAADAASAKYGKLDPHEIMWKRKDGSRIPVFRGFSRLPDDAGYLVVAMDLSALKQTQAELVSANEAKSQFLAHMSHEIRTPLNGVLGMLSMLQGSGLNPSQEAYVDIGQESGKYLLSIINQVLDYSKLGSDQFVLAQDEFLLRTVVSGSLAPVTEQARRKKIEMRFEIDPAIPEAFVGDPVQLQQVLINLLGNAVKFSASGTITMKLFQEEIIEDICRIRVEVEDQGPGIPREKISGLFQPFRQGDESLSRSAGGTGLGLAICKEIVQRMGGNIWVESEIGKGSRFSFTAEMLMSQTAIAHPAIGDFPQNKGSASAGAMAWSMAPTVLVVDDHPINQIVAASMLKRLGCKVDTEPDGESALLSVSMKTYDLVFMDCQMPGMNGFETTRQIRAMEAGSRHLPIVALTAHAVAGVREKCLSYGMDDYVAKPFSDDDMEAILRRWTGHLLRAQESPSGSDSAPIKEASQGKTQTPGQAEALIEWKRFSKIDDGSGPGRETVLELLKLFFESGQSGFAQIRGYLEDGTSNDIKRVLHKLKGGCGTMGASAMHQSISRMEDARILEDRPALIESIDAAERIFQATWDEFRRKYPEFSNQPS